MCIFIAPLKDMIICNTYRYIEVKEFDVTHGLSCDAVTEVAAGARVFI